MLLTARFIRVYFLQPEEVGEVQKAFNIAREGSYIVSVKNPKQGTCS